jgi:hypothetical protein
MPSGRVLTMVNVRYPGSRYHYNHRHQATTTTTLASTTVRLRISGEGWTALSVPNTPTTTVNYPIAEVLSDLTG